MRITAAIVGALATAGFAIGATAVTGPQPGREPAPGPDGHNIHGLCTAYSSGSGTGQEHKREAPPFRALEAAAGGVDGVESYCAERRTRSRD